MDMLTYKWTITKHLCMFIQYFKFSMIKLIGSLDLVRHVRVILSILNLAWLFIKQLGAFKSLPKHQIIREIKLSAISKASLYSSIKM